MRFSVLILVTALSFSMTCEPALAKAQKKKAVKNPKGYYDISNDVNNVNVNDPWQSFNHAIFEFNIGFDRYIFKPVAMTYGHIPHCLRHRIGNFLDNLGEPLNVIHGVLQLKPNVTFTSLWRFLLNTTLGFGGLNDFAQENASLDIMNQNMGKTLGYWGVPAGPYVVLPILGPSSARDTPGRVADWFVDPVNWVSDTWVRFGQATADGIDTRYRRDNAIQHLYYDSLDPYTASRSAFRQHEEFEAKSKD